MSFQKLDIKFDPKKLRQATNQLFTKVSWRHHVVKGLSLTQIPGDPTSAYGEKLRGIFYLGSSYESNFIVIIEDIN